MTETVNY